MKNLRRINLFAEAGGGKTITSANVRAQLGFKGYDVELVEEVIKDWTYVGRSPASCDSFYLQGCQIQKEDIRLRAGVDFIVSDSPLMLQYFYAMYHKAPLQVPMLQACQDFEDIYPSLNIFIDREDKFYDETGRYEKLPEAKSIDMLIKEVLTRYGVSFRSFSCLDQDKVIDYIVSQLEVVDVTL